MPLSDKQLAAKRANAARPITAQGKRNSSRNATRHGILANRVLIKGESRELAIQSIAESGRHLDLMSRNEHRFDRHCYRALEAFTPLLEHRQNAETIARAKRSQLIDENKGPGE